MKKFIFVLTIAIFIMITGCSKFPDLGDGYRFDSDGKYTLEIVNFENTVMIGPHILEYAFDSTFIIASQRPWDSIPNIRTMTYKESNEAFENSTFLQYWIINKKEKSEYSLDTLSKLACYSNVYGPFDKQEYLQKREELGVPKELQLKE
ncbi:MAG: DUF3997 domain-containing protein [Sphingobacteriales bacterium]|nr:MAG: DUF3997 domain-containing protein [Sphingobacteriales bacterium]